MLWGITTFLIYFCVASAITTKQCRYQIHKKKPRTMNFIWAEKWISSLIKAFLLVPFFKKQHFKFSNYFSSLLVMVQLMLVPTNFLISTPFCRIMLTLLLVLKKQGRGFWQVLSVLGSSLGEVWCCWGCLPVYSRITLGLLLYGS